MPKSSIRHLKTDIDNRPCFRYPDGYWFRLIDASIYGAQLMPIHNSPFSIHPLRKSNFFFFIFLRQPKVWILQFTGILKEKARKVMEFMGVARSGFIPVGRNLFFWFTVPAHCASFVVFKNFCHSAIISSLRFLIPIHCLISFWRSIIASFKIFWRSSRL